MGGDTEISLAQTIRDQLLYGLGTVIGEDIEGMAHNRTNRSLSERPHAGLSQNSAFSWVLTISRVLIVAILIVYLCKCSACDNYRSIVHIQILSPRVQKPKDGPAAKERQSLLVPRFLLPHRRSVERHVDS